MRYIYARGKLVSVLLLQNDIYTFNTYQRNDKINLRICIAPFLVKKSPKERCMLTQEFTAKIQSLKQLLKKVSY